MFDIFKKKREDNLIILGNPGSGKSRCYINPFITQNPADMMTHHGNATLTKASLVLLGDTYGLDSSIYNKEEYTDEEAWAIFEYLIRRKEAGVTCD